MPKELLPLCALTDLEHEKSTRPKPDAFTYRKRKFSIQRIRTPGVEPGPKKNVSFSALPLQLCSDVQRRVHYKPPNLYHHRIRPAWISPAAVSGVTPRYNNLRNLNRPPSCDTWQPISTKGEANKMNPIMSSLLTFYIVSN